MMKVKKEQKRIMTDSCKVLKDGFRVFTGSENDCFKFIHDTQSQSVYWACMHSGYEIVSLEKEKEKEE